MDIKVKNGVPFLYTNSCIACTLQRGENSKHKNCKPNHDNLKVDKLNKQVYIEII